MNNCMKANPSSTRLIKPESLREQGEATPIDVSEHGSGDRGSSFHGFFFFNFEAWAKKEERWECKIDHK